MESAFWFALGIATGMAALPWLQHLAARVRQRLAELDLVDPAAARAAPDDERHLS
jgi:hypothetical protein